MLRHRSRHLRATLFNKVVADLPTLGWITAPVNFGAAPIRVIDYQPDERGEMITGNTIAISLGDVINDEDEELGAGKYSDRTGGGLRSAWYPVFVDVFMADQALCDAVCDDIRAIFDTKVFPLVNQIDGTDAAEMIDIEEVLGPDRPGSGASLEQFKKFWRIMRLGVRLYYQAT